jgi:hypothetical protein
MRGKAKKAYEWREPYETALVSGRQYLILLRVECTGCYSHGSLGAIRKRALRLSKLRLV